MGFIKFASASVISAEYARPHAGLMRNAHRHSFNYDPKPGFLYVRSRAISSRTNDNFDTFSAEEIKKAWASFIGKPVFVNHHNEDPTRARGVIIDAALHEDINPDKTPDTWVEVLMEVDAVRFPKLAEAIVKGDIERTSMGVDCQWSKCGFCGKVARTQFDYCRHVTKMKGQRLERRTAAGTIEKVLVHEICGGLGFFENSLLVEPPADPTAYFLGVDQRGLTMTASDKDHGNTDKGNTTDRGYGWDHQKKREELLKDDPKCYWCKDAKATEADHYNNGLVPSCSDCNNDRSHEQQKAASLTVTASKAVRGFSCGFPTGLGKAGTLALFNRLKNKTATADDLILCATSLLGGNSVGDQWAISDLNDEYDGWEDDSALDYAFVDDDMYVKQFATNQGDITNDDEIWAENEDNLGEMAVILIGDIANAKHVNDSWDASVGEGVRISLKEIRYDAGWGWTKISAQGKTVTSTRKTAMGDYVIVSGLGTNTGWEVHAAGCKDLSMPKYQVTMKDTVSATSGQDAVDRYLDDEMQDQGWTTDDFRVFPCAGGTSDRNKNAGKVQCPAGGEKVRFDTSSFNPTCYVCGDRVGQAKGKGTYKKHWAGGKLNTPNCPASGTKLDKSEMNCLECGLTMNNHKYFPVPDHKRADIMGTASRKTAFGETTAPTKINTLSVQECPVCGEEASFDSTGRCRVCSYLPAPAAFRPPDLEVAQKVDIDDGWVNEDLYASAPFQKPDEDPAAEPAATDPAEDPDPAGKPHDEEKDDDDEDKADGTVSKPKFPSKGQKSAGGISMNAAELAARQRQQMARLASQRTADIDNPANPVPEPAQQAATESTEEAKTPDVKEDVTSMGGELPNAAPTATTDPTVIGQVTPEPTAQDTVDVTAPVSGGVEQNKADLKVTPDIDTGGETLGEKAFQEGWTAGLNTGRIEGKQAAREEIRGRVFASLRLAGLRVQAGLANGDQIEIAGRIEASAASDGELRTEINTLTAVSKSAGFTGTARPVTAGRTPSLAGHGAPVTASFQDRSTETTSDLSDSVVW